MNPFWTKLVLKTTLKDKDKDPSDLSSYSRFEIAKGYREFWINVKRHVKDVFLITIAIFSAAFHC